MRHVLIISALLGFFSLIQSSILFADPHVAFAIYTTPNGEKNATPVMTVSVSVAALEKDMEKTISNLASMIPSAILQKISRIEIFKSAGGPLEPGQLDVYPRSLPPGERKGKGICQITIDPNKGHPLDPNNREAAEKTLTEVLIRALLQ